MGDLVAGVAAVAIAVALWVKKVRRGSGEPSFDREAQLRRFGMQLLTVGLAGVGLLLLSQFVFG